jgi:HEAT repeat protein
VQTGLILLVSISLLSVRTYARLKENLHEQIRPAIRDRVLALALEGESWSSEVPRHGPARQVLEDNIAHALGTVKAAGRERVARFAMAHGFAAEWLEALSSDSKNERKRAVSLLGLISPMAGNAALFAGIRDADSGVRTQAYRALLIAGDALGLEQVFQAALRESLLMRALLADDLKRHAAYLLAHTIPRSIENATPQEAARCFEILIAWKRAIPSFDMRPWLAREQDRLLTPLVLGLLPYVLTEDSIAEYVEAALKSPNLELRWAAAEAAGRLKIASLIPALEAALFAERRLAVTAANALAHIGEAGEIVLEKIVVSPDRKAAAVAMEALEHATVRR